MPIPFDQRRGEQGTQQDQVIKTDAQEFRAVELRMNDATQHVHPAEYEEHGGGERFDQRIPCRNPRAQSRQRPRNPIQPSTGTLSCQRIGRLHAGQCDAG